MDFLKTWAIGVCACALVATVFSMVSPKGSMNRMMKLMISVFIFTSVVTPFLSIQDFSLSSLFDFDMESVDGSMGDVQENINRMMLDSTEREVEATVQQTLEDNGYYSCEVDCTAQLDEDYYIQITQVDITVPYELTEEAPAIQSLIESQLELNTTVFTLGD